MAELVVETSEGLTLRRPLAGVGSRAAAALVDFGILLMVWLGGMLAVSLLVALDPTSLSGFFLGLFLGGALVAPVAYATAFGLVWDGQTPGKRLLALRVVDGLGQPPTFLQHFLRSVFWPLECMILLVPVPLAVYLVLFTPGRQRLGDLVAGTHVVREEAGREVEPLRSVKWQVLQEKQLDLSPAVVANLDASDRRLLRDLLARQGLETGAERMLARRGADHFRKRLRRSEGVETKGGKAVAPLRFLRELFLYLRDVSSGRAG